MICLTSEQKEKLKEELNKTRFNFDYSHSYLAYGDRFCQYWFFLLRARQKFDFVESILKELQEFEDVKIAYDRYKMKNDSFFLNRAVKRNCFYIEQFVLYFDDMVNKTKPNEDYFGFMGAT